MRTDGFEALAPDDSRRKTSSPVARISGRWRPLAPWGGRLPHAPLCSIGAASALAFFALMAACGEPGPQADVDAATGVDAGSNANANANTNTNANANTNVDPGGGGACGLWAEGTMDTDDGATRDFYNRGARLPWRNYLGDWHDADGVPQGDNPFAVSTLVDDNSPGFEEWDVTTLVQAWVDGTHANKGFFLRAISGIGTFNFHTKEHPVAQERPELVVVTDQESVTLTPEADTYLAPSTYQGFGDDVEMSISDERPMLLRFDLSTLDASAVVQSATLRLHCFEDYGGSTLEVGVFRSSHGLELPPTDPSPGVAATFPQDQGIASHPSVLLFSDFDSPNWEQEWTSVSDNGNLTPVTDDPGRGFEPLQGAALRVRVAANDNYGGSLIFRFIDELGEEPEEIYFRYYLRFSDDWWPTDSGKLPGISGTYGVAGWGGRPSDGTNGWSARGTYRLPIAMGNPFEDHTGIGNYVYHADMEDIYGDVVLWNEGCRGILARDRWYSVEQYLRMNTPGQTDGVIRGWVDGRLAYEQTNWRFRTVDTLKIEQIWMNFYHGGGGVPPTDIHLYIDNVVVATEYIGPMGE